MKKNRILAIFVALILCFVIGVSSAFIISHVHHDCIGRDCSVCVEIHNCEVLLQNMTGSVGTAAPVGITAVLIVLLAVLLPVVSERSITLITLKVKLSD